MHALVNGLVEQFGRVRALQLREHVVEHFVELALLFGVEQSHKGQAGSRELRGRVWASAIAALCGHVDP